jgi:hypothetical protein
VLRRVTSHHCAFSLLAGALAAFGGCSLDLTGAPCADDADCPIGQRCGGDGHCGLSVTVPDGSSAADASLGGLDAGPGVDAGIDSGILQAGPDAGKPDGGGSDASYADAGVCNSSTCPNGCCSNGGSCESPSASACGIAGAACTNCGLSGDGCVSGQCRCGADAACPSGEHCVSAECACDNYSCPSGCCSGTSCVAGTSNVACGTDGIQCVNCTANALDTTCCPGQSCGLPTCL